MAQAHKEIFVCLFPDFYYLNPYLNIISGD